MPTPLVGHDATVYTFTPYGNEVVGPGPGATYTVLSRWKDIEVEFEKEWRDVSPSSLIRRKKRKISEDWRATCTNQIISGPGITAAGAIGMEIMLQNDYVAVSFTEEGGGRVWTLYGGISRDRMRRDREEGTETFEFENVGDDISPTGSSINYANS